MHSQMPKYHDEYKIRIRKWRKSNTRFKQRTNSVTYLQCVLSKFLSFKQLETWLKYGIWYDISWNIVKNIIPVELQNN